MNDFETMVKKQEELERLKRENRTLLIALKESQYAIKQLVQPKDRIHKRIQEAIDYVEPRQK